MFLDLPPKIHKMIFARVRYADLFETSRVSQEWSALTMASCDTISPKYDRFLEDQKKFYDEIMPREKRWENWMFIEFTDNKTIEFKDSISTTEKERIAYLKRKGIRVEKLKYSGDGSILLNLKSSFPHLKALDICLQNSKKKGLMLPVNLEYLHVSIKYYMQSAHILDIFKNPEHVDSLEIDSCSGLSFTRVKFNNLKRLKINMDDLENKSSDVITVLINGAKQLSCMTLKNGFIDKTWLGLLPERVKEIRMKHMKLDEAMLPLLGTREAFIERHLMRFICQDWTEVHLFKSDYIVFPGDKYRAFYVARPNVLKEIISIGIYENETPTGLLDSGKFKIETLIYKDFREKGDFDIIVPQSVKGFWLKAKGIEKIDFGLIFSDVSAIETLHCNLGNETECKYFPRAANLVSLQVSFANDALLESILSNCPSLKNLDLISPKASVFNKLPMELKSASVKKLQITEAKDSVVDILSHFSSLVELRMILVEMATVTIADLAELESLDFVDLYFKDTKNEKILSLLAKNLDGLGFSHLILGYGFGLFCRMGNEKAFFKSVFSCDTNYMDAFFEYISILYCKGIAASLFNSDFYGLSTLTDDIKEFISKALIRCKQDVALCCVL